MMRVTVLSLVVVACSLVAGAGGALGGERVGTPPHEGASMFRPERVVVQPSVAQEQPWQVLSRLGEEVHGRATLRVDLPRTAPAEARSLAARIETAWNAGEGSAATSGLYDLGSIVDPADMELSLSWHGAVPVHRTDLLAANVRVGALDSVAAVALAANADASRLYTVVSHSSSAGSFHVYRSTDKGDTWTLTQSVIAVGGAPQIAVAPMGQHLYVGYIPTSAGRTFRVRKFKLETGVSDTLVGGAFVTTVLTMASTDTVREIAGTSNILMSSNRAIFLVRMHSKTVRLMWTAPSSDSLWHDLTTSATGVTGGIALAYAQGRSGLAMYISYVSTTTGSPRVVVDTTNATGLVLTHSVQMPTAGGRTTLSAYGDTVLCAYDDWSPSRLTHMVRTLVSYDRGLHWSSENPIDSVWNNDSPVAMLEKGQGMTLFHRFYKIKNPELRVISRNYTSGSNWSTPLPVTTSWAHDLRYAVVALGADQWGAAFVTDDGSTPATGAVVFAKFQRGATAVAEEPTPVPSRIELFQNYPNPFNPSTQIAYELPVSSRVRLTVYDVLGDQVAVLADGMQTAGQHVATWDATGRATGIYFSRLEADGQVVVRKMVLMR